MLPRIWIFLFFLVGGMVVSDPMAAQPIHLDWFRQIGNVSGDESVTALVIDSNKSVIATGAFAGTVDFDTGPGVANLSSAGANDVYFTEYDSTGRFIWAKRIGGGFSDDVLDIKMDNRSNLYILGKFQSTVDFDPGPGVFNVTTTFLSGFLLKLDNNGNFLSSDDHALFEAHSILKRQSWWNPLTVIGNIFVLRPGVFLIVVILTIFIELLRLSRRN